MYVRATSPRFSLGKSTPATLAIVDSPVLFPGPASPAQLPRGGASSLPLLVPRVLADDPRHALAANDLAVLAPHLHRRLHLHGAFSPRRSVRAPAPRYLNRYV